MSFLSSRITPALSRRAWSGAKRLVASPRNFLGQKEKEKETLFAGFAARMSAILHQSGLCVPSFRVGLDTCIGYFLLLYS